MTHPSMVVAESSQVLLKVGGGDQPTCSDLDAAEVALADELVDRPFADLQLLGDFGDGVHEVVLVRVSGRGVRCDVGHGSLLSGPVDGGRLVSFSWCMRSRAASCSK